MRHPGTASYELIDIRRECRRLVTEFLRRPDLSRKDLDTLAVELSALAADATSAVRYLRMRDDWG